MSKENLKLGKFGENLAVDLLREKGYKILARNFRSKLGEIDIIAIDKDTVCFIEVKTRHSNKFGLPIEAVSRAKQIKLVKTAISFLKEKHLFEKKLRFDIVSVLYSTDQPKIELIQNAFEPETPYFI